MNSCNLKILLNHSSLNDILSSCLKSIFELYFA